MEDQIQLTYIFKTLIQSLHKNLRKKKKTRKPLLTVLQTSHKKVKGESLKCAPVPPMAGDQPELHNETSRSLKKAETRDAGQ